VPLDLLFEGSNPHVSVIEEELRRNPRLSDQRIANLLSARGICVARRTVTKYRHRQLSSQSAQ
jgi:DNA-directed RNA polymerase specialized sigma54-like protein